MPEDTSEERKRRRLRPNEVAMLKRFLATYQVGETIQFTNLPDVEMKRSLFPSSQLRLVEKELLRPVYNEDTGLLETVTIDAETLKDYQWDLAAPEPKTIVRQRDPDEVKQRKLRGVLSNPNYHIYKLKNENPKREGTHGWYNWEHCYRNGDTIAEYLSRLDYPRDIMVHGKFGDAWFNGPDSIYVHSDFRNELIGIYDSSKSQDDPDYWLKKESIDSANGEDTTTDDDNGEEVTTSETAPTPVVAEPTASPPG